MFLWSDLIITLSWIKGDTNKWKTFVANLVSDIIKITSTTFWHHVKLEDNPADPTSRGVDPSKLRTSGLWWNGPSWLPEKTNWPKEVEVDNTTEERKICLHTQITIQEESITERFSSLTRMLRTLSCCKRFTACCRKDRNYSAYLTVKELNEMLLHIIKIDQHQFFKNEIRAITEDKPIEKKSKLLTLSPFLDDDGVLRVGGRLDNSAATFEKKHQLILHPKSHLTRLIIDNAHKNTLHRGNQLSLAYICQKYWIVNGKKAVSSILRQCCVCCRYKKQSAQQQMGNLPEPRVTPYPPFWNCGVDYACPISVRTSKGRGHKSYKGYIAVFVCLSTRAIHLETVSYMSTNTFLAAFRRFTARRDGCANLYSDNGTNFVGASKVLAKEVQNILRDTQVQNEIVSAGTQWHFIPPLAPHFGGLWEAGVKSMKRHLRSIIKDTTLTYEELSTLLHKMEACLNSRPLTPLADDIDDIEALTPGHSLIGRELVSPPDPVTTHINCSLTERWKLIHKIKRDFWQAWSSEYLCRLQQRFKWTNKHQNIRTET